MGNSPLNHPPAYHQPYPFWFWNGLMDDKEIGVQIAHMRDAGITEFVIHGRTGLATPFLSDAWFAAVQTALEHAALIAHDRPGLFASVAGTLSCFGMNILKAEAFGNLRSLVLDTFTFADPARTLDLNPSEVDRLHATAERVLNGKTDVKELLRNRPKPVLPSRKAGITPRVSFDSEASSSATLVEIVAEDRPGLLYDLATAISVNGGNIEVVLIDTQAHKAIDVFYVTSGGGKLNAATQAAIREAVEKAAGVPGR
jgi:UTP:GlnB (protein PII) uridylyltransferase